MSKNEELIEEMKGYYNYEEYSLFGRIEKALQDEEDLREGDVQGRNIIIRQLEREIKELKAEARQNAIDGQCAMDEANSKINLLKAELKEEAELHHKKIKEVIELTAKLSEQVDPIEVLKWYGFSQVEAETVLEQFKKES